MGPKRNTNLLLAITIASSFLFIFSRQSAAQQKPATTAQAPSASFTSQNKQASQANLAWHASQGFRFQREWGVDIVGVRSVSSGEMLEFRYRVLDPSKAKPLNDKEKQAVLIDEKTGAKLTVPQMEKVGLLRTATEPKAGRNYWMIFANEKHIVKRGSTVSVNIGNFHVNGLVVQ
jgi:hypothetical protein